MYSQYTWIFGEFVLSERYRHLGVELMEIKPSMSFWEVYQLNLKNRW